MAKLGSILTEEHKRKISLGLMGHKVSDKVREKARDMGIKNHYWLGKHKSEEIKEKISEKLRGKHLSEETKKKISETLFGHKHSEEAKIKIGDAHRGEKCNFWKNGISKNKEYQKILMLNHCHKRRARLLNVEGYFSVEEWEDLKKKYQYTCPNCQKKEPEIKLTRDHIIPLISGGMNWINNIQPLCKSCNSKKHTKILVPGNSIK